MRSTAWSAMILAASLASCGDTPDHAGPPVPPGRYLGIGVYPAGSLWSRMVLASRPRSDAAATLADDEQVIVTVDSHTGEVRQCGNLSGHCIALNPWAAPLERNQAAPVNLDAHAADLANSAEADSAANENAAGIPSNAAAAEPR
jgi:hypothetical protein